MAEPGEIRGVKEVMLWMQERAVNGKISRAYYQAPQVYINGRGADMDSPEAAEYDRMLSEKYPGAPKKYAVYKNILDDGDVYDVMRVISDSKEEVEERKAALAAAIARGDKVAEVAHRDTIRAIRGTTRVNSITYGAKSVFGASTNTRPTEDLKFFNTRQAAQRWLVKRATTYKKPKGKTGGQIFLQWNELNKRIEGAQKRGLLSDEEAKRRKERIWNAYRRYTDNIRRVNKGKTEPDTKFVPRDKYTM